MHLPDPIMDHALDEVMTRVVPLAEAPSGERLPAETLAALGERRLLPEEEAAAVERVKDSPAARVELRTLYPQRYTELLGDAVPSVPDTGGAKVLRFPLRPALAGAATFAAAAAITLFVWPYAPPAHTDFQQVPTSETRSVSDDVQTMVVQPAQTIQLLMRLGTSSTFDRWRGAVSWGALYRVAHVGNVSLVCTSEAGCQRGAGTLSHLFRAPVEPGRINRFVFVSGSELVAAGEAEALATASNSRGGGWPALRDELNAAATAHGWRLHPQRPIVVSGE